MAQSSLRNTVVTGRGGRCRPDRPSIAVDMSESPSHRESLRNLIRCSEPITGQSEKAVTDGLTGGSVPIRESLPILLDNALGSVGNAQSGSVTLAPDQAAASETAWVQRVAAPRKLLDKG